MGVPVAALLALGALPLLAAAVPDPCAEPALDALGLHRDAASAALRLRLLPPGPGREGAQDDALRVLGLGRPDIGRLRAAGALDPDPLEARDLWTLPPAVLANARPGVWVSRPGPGGFLENVLVKDRLGETLVVIRPEDGVVEIMPVRRAHQPVAPGRRVVVEGADGLPELALARDVRGGWVVLDGDVSVPMADLEIAPRGGVVTSGMRAPAPVDEAAMEELEALVEKIRGMHRSKPKGPARRGLLVRANNRFMVKARGMLASQGVSASLEPSGGMEDAWNIRIHGVSPDGNRVAGLYARLAERLNARSLTASVVDNLQGGTEGFFEMGSGRVEIGWDSLLSMMRGEWDNVALHEFTHQMFGSRRESGKASIFDVVFSGRPLGVQGGAVKEENLFEEIYAHAADLARNARRLRHGSAGAYFDVVLADLRQDAEHVASIATNAGFFLDDAMRNFRAPDVAAARRGLKEDGDLELRGGPGSGARVAVPWRFLTELLLTERDPSLVLLEEDGGAAPPDLADRVLRSIAAVRNFADGLLARANKVLAAIDAPAGSATTEEKARNVIWEVGRLRLMTRERSRNE